MILFYRSFSSNTNNTKSANIYISSTFNNTFITLTKVNGDVLYTSSGGLSGFKGAKRSTSYAAQVAADHVSKKCISFDFKYLTVYIKGIGDGRDSAIRSFATNGLKVTKLIDITPVAHNGCRPPKARRV